MRPTDPAGVRFAVGEQRTGGQVSLKAFSDTT